LQFQSSIGKREKKKKFGGTTLKKKKKKFKMQNSAEGQKEKKVQN